MLPTSHCAPAVLWYSGWASAERQGLSTQPHVAEVLGKIVFAGFTVPKLCWLKVHDS